MTIRRLVPLLIGAFALLSAGAGLWQLADSRAKVRAVEWLQLANRMADEAQRTSAQLAMERGVTAAILADPAAATVGMQVEMQRARASVDGLHAGLAALTGQLAQRAPEHPLFDTLADIRESHAEMLRRRGEVDEQLRGGSNALDAERWMALLTRRIEELQTLTAIGTLPLEGNEYTYASLPIIKDVLFTLSEHLGRERGMVGVAIARGAPLSDEELTLLSTYRVVAVGARRRIEAILEHMPPTPSLSRAQSTFVRDLLEHYEALRAEVYASSAERRPYPVDAEQWYHGATTGIDAVLALTAAISEQFERDIDRLRAQADRTPTLLAQLLLGMIMLFAVTLYVVRRRVLRPLGILENAAATVSRGDLSQPLPQLDRDEFGSLGQTFEHMRRTLLDDIRRREEVTSELRKFKVFLEHSASAVFVTDARGIIEYVNPRFHTVTGYSPEEAIGRKAGFWRSGMTALPEYRAIWDTVLRGGVWEGELINRHKNGELYWASVSVCPVTNEAGEIVHLIGRQNDITARRRLEKRLDFLSSYDELTHLPNRALLVQRFLSATEDARRHGTLIGIVRVGIRHFKRINDSLGQETGDHLLIEIGRRLSQGVRSRDVVSRDSGTEFVMMLTGLVEAEELADLLEPIVAKANLPLVIRGTTLRPVISVGASLMPRDGETLEALLRKATIALHHAEAQGMEYCMYAEVLDQEMHERVSLESALRGALERNQLELHYQPKVELLSGRIVGVEALLRWRRAETCEYVPPDRFIPIAEESGLIQQLGVWVMREACRQNRAWQEAGLPGVVVAVNLSASQLRQPDLVDVVGDILSEAALDATLLELELTESALMDNPEQANRVLRQLKGLGLRLAIDDFGTGYSSLAYLSQFPVDRLKIDQSFVSQVTSDAAAAAISTSVIMLAHQMGLKVIAEGVETAEQLAFLHRHGCDEIQGYLYSKPLPAQAMAALLAGGRRLTLPGAQPPSRTLLVVDDDPAVLATVSLALENEDYRVLSARSGREALELLACNPVQVVVTDERMPGMSGAEFLERVRTLYPDTVRIVFSGYVDAHLIMHAVNRGLAYKYFAKPWDNAQLREQILEAFRHHDAGRNRESDREMDIIAAGDGAT